MSELTCVTAPEVELKESLNFLPIRKTMPEKQ